MSVGAALTADRASRPVYMSDQSIYCVSAFFDYRTGLFPYRDIAGNQRDIFWASNQKKTGSSANAYAYGP
jgi:hypothetical protein